MKKTLLALSLAAMANTWPSDIKISRASVSQYRQHPSLKHGKSGVAAAKRAARKRKNKG